MEWRHITCGGSSTSYAKCSSLQLRITAENMHGSGQTICIMIKAIKLTQMVIFKVNYEILLSKLYTSAPCTGNIRLNREKTKMFADNCLLRLSQAYNFKPILLIKMS